MKYREQRILKDGEQVSEKSLKKCWTTVVNREMQSDFEIFYLTTVRVYNINETNAAHGGKDVGWKEH